MELALTQHAREAGTGADGSIIPSPEITAVKPRILEIELENVRSFANRPWGLELRPLTLICGTNGAGKSTLANSLLLLQQSLVDGGGVNPPGKLVCQGSKVDVGSFESVVSFRETERTLMVSMRVAFDAPLEIVRELPSVGTATLLREDTAESLMPFIVSVAFYFTSNHPPRRRTVSGSGSDEESGWLHRAEFSLSLEDNELLRWHVCVDTSGHRDRPVDYLLRMPYEFARAAGAPVLDIVEGPDHWASFPCFLNGLLPDRVIAKVKRTGLNAVTAADEDVEERIWPLTLPLAASIEAVRRALVSIEHLPPGRGGAPRYFIRSTPDIAARDLWANQLSHPERLTGWDLDSTHGQGAIEVNLRAAINRWLHFVRTGEMPSGEDVEEFLTKALHPSVTEVLLRSPLDEKAYPMADSGYGFSQIIQVLLLCLRAEPGSLVILDQPELHLNPALQVRIAEFLLAMVKAGKRFLIETHNEHIVNAVRVHVAEDETMQAAGFCSVIFLDVNDGGLDLYPLKIEEDGMILDWPNSFLGDALNLQMRLLSAQARFL
jgi:predicted ATPase